MEMAVLGPARRLVYPGRVEFDAPGADRDAIPCQICGDAVLPGEALACSFCATPHHRDCWDYAGRCATYGCGGMTAAPWEAAETTMLVVDESTRAPLHVGARLGGLARWARGRAQDLPSTLRGGALGGAMTFGAYLLFFGQQHGFWNQAPAIATALGGVAVGHALLAPLLAPAQHRYPIELAAGSGVLFLLLFSLADFPHRYWTAALPLAMALATLAIVFASAVAELVLGRFSALARALGRLARPARMLVTGLAFGLLCCLGVVSVDMRLAAGVLREIFAWSLLAGLAGDPAMEAGKEEYRKHLVALGEAKQLPASP